MNCRHADDRISRAQHGGTTQTLVAGRCRPARALALGPDRPARPPVTGRSSWMSGPASSPGAGPSPAQKRPPQRRTVVAVVLVVAAGIWILVNGPVEGPTLVVVTAQHGLTVADLFSLVALAVAAVLLLTSRR